MKFNFALKHTVLSLLSASLVIPFTSAETPQIIEPANGTKIAPGSAFDFSYTSIADYGVSAYNYTVWLFTSLPDSNSPSIQFASGYDFGKFAEPNYPGQCSCSL